MKLRRGPRLVEILVVVTGVLVVAVTLTVLARSADGPAVAPESSVPPATSSVPVTVAETSDDGTLPLCSDVPGPEGTCTTVPVIEEDSLAGATERYTAGSLVPSDVQYVLLSPQDWDTVLGPSLGQAELTPGAPVDGLLAASGLLGSAELRASWQQEWSILDGALVEQIFVFASADQSQTVLSGWRTRLLESGLSEFDTAEFRAVFPPGTIGDESFSTTFSDPSATGFFASRRCASQTMAAIGPVLLVVTLFRSECQDLRPAVPAGLIRTLTPRIRALVPG